MKILNFVIKEQESKNGKKYLALFIVTDDKDNPEKFLGYVNTKSITTLSSKK